MFELWSGQVLEDEKKDSGARTSEGERPICDLGASEVQKNTNNNIIPLNKSFSRAKKNLKHNFMMMILDLQNKRGPLPKGFMVQPCL